MDNVNPLLRGGAMIGSLTKMAAILQEIASDPIWAQVVFTQDWHPADHISFFSNWRRRALDPAWVAAHPANISLFEEVVFARNPPYAQVLWPDHCVQNTSGRVNFFMLKGQFGEIFYPRTFLHQLCHFGLI